MDGQTDGHTDTRVTQELIHALASVTLLVSISCHRRTRATRYITANVLRANKVDVHCGKLATGLN